LSQRRRHSRRTGRIERGLRGEVELGLQQISELRLEPGLAIVGQLPEDLQKSNVVTAAVSSKAEHLLPSSSTISSRRRPPSL
jgi:molybdate transport system substrate-binding protein